MERKNFFLTETFFANFKLVAFFWLKKEKEQLISEMTVVSFLDWLFPFIFSQNSWVGVKLGLEFHHKLVSSDLIFFASSDDFLSEKEIIHFLLCLKCPKSLGLRGQFVPF